ncbi:MAG: ParA family protein [Pyrinomonadaceae bacterium]|nr:ParA family protein [Pyrinomonadaceae bacterium]
MKKPEAKIIAVSNQKGGAGKSTVTTNLAVELAHRGYEVLVIDSDAEQQSTMVWSARREQVNESGELPFVQTTHLPAKNLRNVHRLRDKYEYILIDGGARITEEAHAAVAVADYLLVPVKTSELDVESTVQFLKIVSLGMKRNDALQVSILINGMNEQSVLGQTVLEQLEQWEDFKLLKTRLGQYQAFQDAVSSGMGVVELGTRTAVKPGNQVRALCTEIMEMMKK